MTQLDVLTEGELERLDELEGKIERGLASFMEVGNALLLINQSRLYRSEYRTFEDYCQQRWGLKRQRAYELMQAASVVSEISDRPPVKESHAAELALVPQFDRADVWRETNERTGGKPTAAAVRKIHEERTERPRPDPPPRPSPVMLTLRTHKGEEVPYPKPQGKATFNESTGEGISWAAWSWNPVTGCLHGCDYCYARAIAHRYRDTYPAGFTPLFHEQRLDAPSNTTIPERHRDNPAYRRVFVCSMADLYGRWVPDEWLGRVHDSMLAAPDWQYILLTKFPARYVGLDIPPNAWIGTSVDEQKRVRIAQDAMAKLDGGMVKWLSLEPLREPLEFDDLSMFDWVVIGAQTETHQPEGPVGAFAPPWDWWMRIAVQAHEAGCRVHIKPNLFNGRPGAMPNEYPDGGTPTRNEAT